MPRQFRHVFAAVLLLVSMLCQETWALAGTTGGLSGTVIDASTRSPLANARITASSPSQTASTLTDASGHFIFVSLAPDSYDVSIQKEGYEPASQPGVTVFADQTQTLALQTTKALKEIGNVTSRAASALVKAGTTSDVYSVSATQAEKAGVLGGGGNLNNAYSAISSVPGAYVPQGSQGYGQGVFIRGSDYDQIGYEFDGVPVNRSFDQYAGGTLSNLGQQELQVYTGGAPASSSSAAISGFINQVIRTGTHPGFGNIDFSIGGPTFYHKLTAEVGGATPNRNFSYYAGAGGYNQSFRLWDNNNGGGLPLSSGFATPINDPENNSVNGLSTGVVPFCNGAALTLGTPSYPGGGLPAGMSTDPGCYAFAPGQIANGNLVQADAGGAGYSDVNDREGVANVHILLPHKNDSSKDDIQILFSASALFSKNYGSQNDIGVINAFNAFGGPSNNPQCTNPATGAWTGVCGSTLNYLDPPLFIGVPFGTPATGLVAKPYLDPASPTQRQPGALLDPSIRDGFNNDQNIVKVQYQKNFGTNAYARVYGYTFYSDWLINGPNYNATFLPTAFGNNFGNIGPLFGQSPDYELNTHTKGVELQLVDQIDSRNLLTGTFNYTTAVSTRINNTSFTQLAGTGSRATNDTDGTNCYTATGAVGTCNRPPGGFPVTQGTFAKPVPFPAVAGTWIVTNNGQKATFNSVVPKFTSFALSDQWRPSEKLLFNVGLRFERFQFDLSNTHDNGKDFWFAAGQKEFCYDTQTLSPIQVNGRPFATLGNCATDTGDPNAVHPDGKGSDLLLTNNYAPSQASNIVSPRIAGTYTINGDSVIRFSYGKYAQPVSSAFVQYNTQQSNLASFLFNTFWKYGFTSPSHNTIPAVSDNYDISLEHRIPKTDVSFKLSPYYRTTRDQVQQFYLDPTTGFVSGLNVGRQTSYGVEFQIQKGDFNRNGLSGQLSYAYNNSKIRYNDFRSAPGHNVIDVLNQGIIGYNQFTKTCSVTNAAAATDPRCGYVPGGAPLTAAQLKASPCYVAGGGGGTTCAGATDIANPYYNDPTQPLLDRNGSYYPFDIFPGVAQFNGLPAGGTNSYYVPTVVTAILNWRKDRLAITPSLQYNAGNRYGVPLDTPGIDPSSCGNNQANAPVPGTHAATAPFGPQTADYTSCFNPAGLVEGISVPNPENGGAFTGLGQYKNPAQISLNAQITYDMSAKVRAALTLTNIVNRCFGGDTTPWSSAFGNSHVCAYGSNGFAQSPIAPHGGFFNGTGPNDVVANGAPLNPYIAHTYQPASFVTPFNAYLNFTFKI